MPNTSFTQQALASAGSFHTRVRNALATVAWQVLGEDPDVEYHAERASFARSVIRDLPNAAASITPWLVDRPNLIAFETSYDFEMSSVVTASGDADIESQIHTDWNTLVGVSPPPPTTQVMPPFTRGDR